MKKPPFPDHKGKATIGSRLVPLAEFATESERHGRTLDEAARTKERARFLASRDDGVPVEGAYDRVAVFGGIYNNHRSLTALLEDRHVLGSDQVYCLGDLGGFGPSPEKIRPLVHQGNVLCIQGNYEESLSTGHEDCNCGYTDPRDNRFAELSYRYTERNCGANFKQWLGRFPKRRRVQIGKFEALLVHGSPRRINEFLFESSTSDSYLERLLDEEHADILLCTHTGIHWHRILPSGRHAVNVGAIGRPDNDGNTEVHFATLSATTSGVQVDLRDLPYDHQGLAKEMRAEQLPEEFTETIETGWWTTCLEVLPPRERRRSRY